MKPPRCACGDLESQHEGAGGRCLHELPEDLAVELPAWRCLCRRYRYSAVVTLVVVAGTVRDRTVTDAPLAV